MYFLTIMNKRIDSCSLSSDMGEIQSVNHRQKTMYEQNERFVSKLLEKKMINN